MWPLSLTSWVCGALIGCGLTPPPHTVTETFSVLVSIFKPGYLLCRAKTQPRPPNMSDVGRQPQRKSVSAPSCQSSLCGSLAPPLHLLQTAAATVIIIAAVSPTPSAGGETLDHSSVSSISARQVAAPSIRFRPTVSFIDSRPITHSITLIGPITQLRNVSCHSSLTCFRVSPSRTNLV